MTTMPPGGRGLPYRPALDGLRAVAVLAVMAYHAQTTLLPGGWLGVDVFFVISGYLITTILLAEKTGWGRISLGRFWAARARRLLPALVPVLCAVLFAANMWTIPARRSSVALDVVSTMAYVANWRMLLGDEAYFASIASPSPLRHAWSLAVEEQFYLIFPLLLIGLMMFLRRRHHLAVAFGVLAALSASWAFVLFEPGVDPSRIYYGTDTRAQELLVGAAVAALLSPGKGALPAGVRARLDSWTRKISLPAGLFVVSAFLWGEAASSFLFAGGLLPFSIVVAVVVVAAASTEPTRLGTLLSTEVLRRIGLISYGLYLWHWPVMVYATPERVGIGGPALFLVQIGVTFALAAASYVSVEQPVRKGGLRALIPQRPRFGVAVGVLAGPLLLTAAIALPSNAVTTPEAGPSVTVSSPRYEPSGTTTEVLLLGNSVPLSFFDHIDPTTHPDVELSQATSLGCEPLKAVKLSDGVPAAQPEGCVEWRADWPRKVAATEPDIVAFFLPHTFLTDRRLGGQDLAYGTREHRDYLVSELDRVRETALSAGADHFVVINLACHEVPDFDGRDEVTRMNDEELVEDLNALVAQWAEQNDASVIDQYGLLCEGGFHGQVNGAPLYADYMHYTRRSANIIWDWLAPKLRDIAHGVG